MNNHKDSSKENTLICGFAFNNKDNHKRITTGENFSILGGSAETHETLVKKVIEFNEVIKKYGKKLENLSESEYYDVVNEICAQNEKIYWFYRS